jgi:hypothetical protein
MFRRQFLYSLLGATVLAWLARPLSKVWAQGGSQIDQLDLYKELAQGLRARRPVEFQYVEEVVALVKIGYLPRPLVDSTFGWARKKSRNQLQYFAFALQERAKQLGLHAPSPPT